MRNEKVFMFRLHRSDRERIEKMAKKEDRSMSWIIRDAIKKRFELNVATDTKKSNNQ